MGALGNEVERKKKKGESCTTYDPIREPLRREISKWMGDGQWMKTLRHRSGKERKRREMKGEKNLKWKRKEKKMRP